MLCHARTEVLPWRSLTETVNLALGRPANGLISSSSQTLPDFGLKREARFFLEAISATGKLAVTRKLSIFNPVQKSYRPTRMRVSGLFTPACE